MTEAIAHATLVESIPKGLEDLRGTQGVQYTEDVLVRLTGQANSTIDLTAMYWNLLPDPKSVDEGGFTQEQFDAMGAGAGKAILDALRAAAQRNVQIRILESPGFSPNVRSESAMLREEFPNQVRVYSVTMGDWYGGSGIMHQKIWIFDQRDIYLGSVNMDWKSITQVKEMGIAVETCPALAADVTRYFDSWCAFSALTPSSVEVFDESVCINRRVPPWSTLVPDDARAPSPLEDALYAAAYSLQTPLTVNVNDESGGIFVTGCPPEVRGPGRSNDGAGLIYTIHDARRTICISAMDFAPLSLYSRTNPPEHPTETPNDTPVWWPPLIDALLSAALTRKIYVRLLVSKWAYSSSMIEPLLRALQLTADAGRTDRLMTTGQFEIKQFVVPGWDNTSGSQRKFPGHSRVNHAKYIVTDRRINIGTSNMTWDYFASTAGSSFNADHCGLVRALQSAFDRDWASPYAYHLA